VTVELICDGVHVSEPAMQVLMRAVRGRMALITDAMAAAGSSDGSYLLGALAVDVVGGVARLHEGGSIAGSTLLLDAAFRRAVFDLGVAVPEAVAMLTATPARTLGVQDRLGRLAPGFAADVLLWDEGLHLLRGWAAGQEFSAA
jgi:N-acetylglucosamine-6-phosphate deacetylase